MAVCVPVEASWAMVGRIRPQGRVTGIVEPFMAGANGISFLSAISFRHIFPAGTGRAMDLRQLTYFVRVAELSSFTRAASLLGVAQPALSRQIRS